MTEPTVFISYSRKDEQEKDELLKHLSVLQGVNVWSDDQIGAGVDWKQEIEHAMAQAQVAVLLITANFLTSDFIFNKEIPDLLKRCQDKGMLILPVIAKACAWQTIDWLQKIEVRPRNARPVWSSGGSHIDEDLTEIALEVEAIIKGTPKPKSLISAQQHYKEERFLDAAIPKEVVVGKETELLVMIRLPDSAGLRGILSGDVEDFHAKPQDVKDKKFETEFPVDARGYITSSELLIEIETTGFTSPECQKKVKVEPKQDTEPCVFLLTPIRRGEIKVLVQVYQADNKIQITRGVLTVNGRTKLDEGVGVIKALITMSLGVFGIDAAEPSDSKATEQKPVPVKEPIPPSLAADDPYAGMSDLERLLAEEGIDLGTVSEDRPEGSEGMSARDWMISTSDDEMIRNQVGAEPIDKMPEPTPEPALIRESPETAPVPELVIEDDKMVVEDDLPDWLRGEEDEFPLTPEPVVAVDEGDKMVVEDDLPDWLREEEDTLPSVPEPMVVDDDTIVEEDDLPDWLREVQEEEVESPLSESVADLATAVSADNQDIEDEDLPDWLREVQEEEVAPKTIASTPIDASVAMIY